MHIQVKPLSPPNVDGYRTYAIPAINPALVRRHYLSMWPICPIQGVRVTETVTVVTSSRLYVLFSVIEASNQVLSLFLHSATVLIPRVKTVDTCSICLFYTKTHAMTASTVRHAGLPSDGRKARQNPRAYLPLPPLPL